MIKKAKVAPVKTAVVVRPTGPGDLILGGRRFCSPKGLRAPRDRDHSFHAIVITDARSVGVSAGSVAAVVTRATHTGLTWEAVTALTDEQLEQALWGPRLPLTAARSAPEPLHIHTELRRKGGTLELLHLEYLGYHLSNYFIFNVLGMAERGGFFPPPCRKRPKQPDFALKPSTSRMLRLSGALL